MSLLVRFDAELVLLADEVPETESFANLQQAVQDQIGHTGAIVLDVTDYESKP